MPAVRTSGTWTREQALANAEKGRAVRRILAARRREAARRLANIASEPPSKLPPLLREQIAGASLHLEKAQREGKAKQVKEWISVVRRLVELERYVSTPPARKQSNGTPAAQPGPVVPKLATSSKASSSTPVEQVAGQVPTPAPSPAAGSTSPNPEHLEPLEPEPFE